MATINLPKSLTFLGDFCKGVKIIKFSSEIIFGQLLQTFDDFLLVTLLSIAPSRIQHKPTIALARTNRTHRENTHIYKITPHVSLTQTSASSPTHPRPTPAQAPTPTHTLGRVTPPSLRRAPLKEINCLFFHIRECCFMIIYWIRASIIFTHGSEKPQQSQITHSIDRIDRETEFL